MHMDSKRINVQTVTVGLHVLVFLMTDSVNS
jgi:hypothetical protein